MSGNAHLRRLREEQMYREVKGAEALKRQKELQSLSTLCTCVTHDPAFKAKVGHHHHPGCPNYRTHD